MWVGGTVKVGVCAICLGSSETTAAWLVGWQAANTMVKTGNMYPSFIFMRYPIKFMIIKDTSTLFNFYSLI